MASKHLLPGWSVSTPQVLSRYNQNVEIWFDPRKSERNFRERNLGFEQAVDFDFATATYDHEVRNGEKRMVAASYLNGRLHILCFLPKPGGIRVISFRKANDREARKYGKPKTIDE
jgi:hypothetical protein